jgi:hypothetical protein
MDKLKHYLHNIPTGKVTHTRNVENLLAQCWEQLDGHSNGSMAEYKICGRTENMEWNPPFLNFTIERHGAMMFGSSQAELQHWSVNVERGTASLNNQGIRQKRDIEPTLKTKPLAENIGKLILEKKECKELKWDDDKTHVRIMAGEIIPDDVAKQTLAGRRKRFRKDLTTFLENYGWQEVRPNNYHFVPSH